MQLGGNERLKIFLQIYNIPHKPMKDKYLTKGVQYYRDLIAYEAGIFLDPPGKLDKALAAEKMDSGAESERFNHDLSVSFAEGGNPFESEGEEKAKDVPCECTII